jgi:hypothetical protein
MYFKNILAAVTVLVSFVCNSQETNAKPFVCTQYRELNLQCDVVIAGQTNSKTVGLLFFIENGLRIELNDSSFHIIGFTATYDCHSMSLSDFSSRNYSGNKILKDDSFVKGAWIGDIFVITCITVERNGQRFILPGHQFVLK